MKNLMNLIGASLLLLCSGCADELPEPIRRPRTVVHFAADWSNLASDIPVPETLLLRIDDEIHTLEGPRGDVTLLSETGHTVVAHTDAAGITVSGTSAAVATRYGELSSDPGMLAAAVVELDGLDDVRSLDVPLAMKQCTFELHFVVHAGREEVISATGILSGIAAGCDLRTGEVLASGDARIGFAVSRNDAGTQLDATVRILGVVPDTRQLLSLEVPTAGGETLRFESDLTEPLAGLAARDDKTALTLSADMASSETTGSVLNWTVVDGGKIEL